MSRTLTVDAATRLLTDGRCPDCSGTLYATDGIVSEAYAPALYFKGDVNELPRRERPVVLLCCSGCEYTKEITA